MAGGESPLYAKRYNKNYVGIEINPATINGYLLPFVQKAINETKTSLFNEINCKVEIRLGDSSKFFVDLINRFDLCYTSPPYFNFEDYGFSNSVVLSCSDYDEYHQRVTIPVFTNVYQYLIETGILVLQTEKNKKLKNKWIDCMKSIGFVLIQDTLTGQEENKYSIFSKRDQTLLIFKKKQ